jgi:hypothetical protein
MVTKSRRMKLAENVARMGEVRNAYKITVGKPEWKILFWRSLRGWKNIPLLRFLK